MTANVFRPGWSTRRQAWIRDQDPDEIGETLHERFTTSYAEGALITPEESAAVLLDRMRGDATGEVWDAADAT